MKKLSLILATVLVGAAALAGLKVYGQPTPAPRVKAIGVFAQPVVDAKGVKLLEKWYAAGTRVFVGWASIKNTSGVNAATDRAAQLEWRAAVRALGPDARYVDYVLPDWKLPATAADVALMVNDPQCLGVLGPEEPNLSPPSDTTGKVWRVSIDQWKAYWAPVLAGDPGNTKIRVGDFAGNKLSAAWGFYTGADAVPYADALTALCTNAHPRNNYGDTRADCDDYPRRAVSMLARISGNKPRWYISECAEERLSAFPQGRAPTYPELQAQLAGVFATNTAAAPIDVWLWFPQKPVASAAHVFDNTTAQQFETVKVINAALLGTGDLPRPPPATLPTTAPTSQPTPPDAVAALSAQVTALTQRVDYLGLQQQRTNLILERIFNVPPSIPPVSTTQPGN